MTAPSRLRPLRLRPLRAAAAVGTALPFLAALPDAAGAQTAAPRVYVYVRGADTVGTERLTVTDSAISGSLTLGGAPRIEWSQARRGDVFGALSLRFFAPGGDASAPPVQFGTVVVRGDSAHVDITSNGRNAKQAAPSKAGALPIVNASVLHAAVLGLRAIRAGRTSMDLFLSSGGQTVPALLVRRGDTLVMNMGGNPNHVLLGADGLPREILIPSQNARVVLATGAVPTVRPPGPPSYDAPAGAPYVAEHVRIPTGRGYDLAATLTRPRGVAKSPVVVTISGSGPQDRDSRIGIVSGYAIFRDIADTLARRGIATLRFDDRGVGQSGGRETAGTATSADFADDVRSIVAWLRARPDIDAARVGLVGHSEGGVIAPLVAAKDPAVRAVVLLAGPGYTGRRILLWQNREAVAAANLPAARRDSILRTVPAQLDSAARANPWIRFFISHDPLMTARQLKQPVLVLQGQTDRQVTPEQADTLAAAMRAAGNANVTLRKFPGTNHLFLTDPVGAASGYAALKDTRVRRDVLGTLADWLSATLK